MRRTSVSNGESHILALFCFFLSTDHGGAFLSNVRRTQQQPFPYSWRERPPMSSLLVLKEPDKDTASPIATASILSEEIISRSPLYNPIDERYQNDPSTLYTTKYNLPRTTTSMDRGTYKKRRSNPDDPNAEYRYSASDWWQIVRSTFRSSTLKYTRGPITAIMIWSYCLSAIYSLCHWTGYMKIAQRIANYVPSTIPHAATVSVLGLLLVFRTTSAYQKFDEGRLIWERILSITRNMTRQIYLYPEFSPERTARILQLLAAYPYFLHQHVKPIITKNTQTLPQQRHFLPILQRRKPSSPTPNASPTQSVISHQLPWSLFFQDENPCRHDQNRQIIQQLMRVENRPLWICDRIAEEIMQVPCVAATTYTSMERTILLQFLNELTEAISECERIHRTTVPLNYARHSLRGITFWLFTLPLTLLKSYGWWTAPVMGLTAWLLYGIYQIGYMIEDPFQGTIRLTTLCNNIYRDVVCDPRRTSAFAVSLGESGDWKDLPL